MIRPDTIDPVRALQLKALGLSYRRVGEIMANEQLRPVAFQANSVENVVRQFRKDQDAQGREGQG